MTGFLPAGLLASEEVRTALLVGGVVAVVSGMVGVLTVLRGQSFAGHALADVGTTGGAGAFLVAIPPLWGFLALSLAGAAAMELIGVQRARSRDLATGVVLGAGLGLAALFLYWDTTVHNTTGAAMVVLFGSIFAIGHAVVAPVIVAAVVAACVVAALYRPLLLCAIHPDLAAARGVPVRTVGAVFLAAMAVTVALSAVTIGSILSTALLVGPAATAIRLTRRPARAMVYAALVGVVAVWGGVVLAYESYRWPPSHHGWPVSFFVVAIVFVAYLAADLPGRGRR
ncbi:metal ABC transporter permease [Tsukamurella soli]|uniref:Metal ABC transporter permease n=1 Tax=Tsukamurella soli TaxID=644556 RepID=A0ABP8JFF1_9ACTN